MLQLCNVTKHQLGLSPSQNTPQHEEGKLFYFFHALLEEGLPGPLTSAYFTHVSPIITAIKFITGTRPLEVTFGIPISH
jgi:hypothetical protein